VFDWARCDGAKIKHPIRLLAGLVVGFRFGLYQARHLFRKTIPGRLAASLACYLGRRSTRRKETPSLFPLERHTSATKPAVTRRGETKVEQFGFANLTVGFVERSFFQEEKGGTSCGNVSCEPDALLVFRLPYSAMLKNILDTQSHM
jgi:hypothetical protein